MFALRGIAVSLAFFVLLYGLLSLLVVLVWRLIRFVPSASERGIANLLFTARIFPLAASLLLTLFLVIPSFDILEPRSIDEHVGGTPLLLGIGAVLLICCGVWRVIAAQRRASRLVASWLEKATPLGSGEIADTFQSRSDVPPLTLIGVCRPKVLVSESTVALLNQEELRVALRHEVSHMRAHDNLKKLTFRLSPCPGMGRLESAWSQAAELNADAAAVSSAREAVDLASALVKLSRLASGAITPACTVGFVTGTVETRVARLLAWEENGLASRGLQWYGIVPIASALLGLVLIYGPALMITHEITEWLVR